jgi:hypothetical protein
MLTLYSALPSVLAQWFSRRPILRHHRLPRLVPGVYVLWLLRKYHLWRHAEDLCGLTSVEVSELLPSDRVIRKPDICCSQCSRAHPLYLRPLGFHEAFLTYWRRGPLHPLPCASFIPLAAIGGAIHRIHFPEVQMLFSSQLFRSSLHFSSSTCFDPQQLEIIQPRNR